MNKKSYIIVAIALILGLILGYVVSSSQSSPHEHKEETGSIEKETIWTCSMHLQIKMKESGQCPICGMDLIPLTDGGGTNPNAISFNEGEVEQNNIQVIEVGESKAQKVIRLDGKVKVNENNSVVQSAHYSGRIEQLNVQYEGQFIKKGALIAKVYSPELIKAQKELLESLKRKSENPLLYNASKKKLESWKISKVQIEAIEKEGKTIDFLSIYAENSGVITQLNVELGNYIKKGQKLVQLANLSSLWVELEAYERDLAWLKINQEVDLEINTGKQTNYSGVISYIDPIINAKSRTAKIRIVLKNNGELKPEMFAVGTLEITNSSDNVTVIPKSSVLWTGKRSVYYKEIERHTYSMQEVVLGKDLGEYYQVIEGVDKGDRIVKTGTFVIDAAAQLQGKPSMMNKPKKLLISKKTNNSSDEIFKLYLEGTSALQQKHEKHVKMILGKIMDSIPSLKEKYPHILHYSGDELKQHFSDFSLDFKKDYNFNQEVYLVKCPMANSDKGGYWLSEDKSIDNPYFGGEMLTCGSVVNDVNPPSKVESEVLVEKDFPNYHPLIVHFPIVLIVLAFSLHLLSYIVDWNIHKLNVGILVVGVLTGSIAAFIIHPHAENLTDVQLAILEEHELLSYITIALGSLASVVYWKTIKMQDSINWKKISLTVLLGLGTVFISLSGHHGAQLTHIEKVNTNSNHNNH
jgi:Cu(I)/Ag(I) efflux system membrane fusion protein